MARSQHYSFIRHELHLPEPRGHRWPCPCWISSFSPDPLLSSATGQLSLDLESFFTHELPILGVFPCPVIFQVSPWTLFLQEKYPKCCRQVSFVLRELLFNASYLVIMHLWGCWMNGCLSLRQTELWAPIPCISVSAYLAAWSQGLPLALSSGLDLFRPL